MLFTVKFCLSLRFIHLFSKGSFGGYLLLGDGLKLMWSGYPVRRVCIRIKNTRIPQSTFIIGVLKHVSFSEDKILFFLWLNNTALCIDNHIFFIHSSFDGHIGWFHILPTVYCATSALASHCYTNFDFFEYLPWNNILESNGSPISVSE